MNPGFFLRLLGLVAVAAGTQALPEDSRQPITIRTDEAIRDETRSETRYRGDVEFRQGSLLIRADEVILVEGNGPAGRRDAGNALANAGIVSIKAIGTPAYLTQQLAMDATPVEAEAEVVEYLQPQGRVLLRSAAQVRQGGMLIRASRMDYDIEQQLIRAFGNAAAGTRVSTTIPPEQLNAD